MTNEEADHPMLDVIYAFLDEAEKRIPAGRVLPWSGLERRPGRAEFVDVSGDREWHRKRYEIVVREIEEDRP